MHASEKARTRAILSRAAVGFSCALLSECEGGWRTVMEIGAFTVLLSSARRRNRCPRSPRPSLQQPYSLLDDRNIAGASKHEGTAPAAGIGDEPGASCWTENRDVRLAIKIVVAWHRNVSPATPGQANRCQSAGLYDKPRARRGAENRDVGFAISIVVAWHRNITRATPGHASGGLRGVCDDEPGAGRWAKDRDIGDAVAIVVARYCDIACTTPNWRDTRLRLRLPNVPRAGRGPEDRDVGLAITVVVARHRTIARAAPRECGTGAARILDVSGAGGGTE